MKKQTKHITIIILTILSLVALVALVACSAKVKVTVDFGLDGVDNVTIEVKSNESLLSALEELRPTDAGFFFDGWYMPDGSKITEKTTVNENVTVKAKWSATYKVEYYLQGNDGQFQLSSTHSQSNLTGELGSTVTAAIKQIDGYGFDENNPANVTSAVLNANGVTLKLYYVLDTVTVRFDAGLLSSVDGSTGNLILARGSSLTLPASGYQSTKAGVTFAGWNTASDGSGETYQPGEKTIVTDDMTLYAMWNVAFAEEIWAEKSGSEIGDEIEFELITTLNRSALLGTTVSSTSNPRVLNKDMYALDTTVSGSVNNGAISEDGLKLVSYYVIRIYSVRYADVNMELGEPTMHKYGTKINVQTPAQSDTAIILRYSTSRTGNGIAYEFGDEVVVTGDIIFYPVIEDVYSDEAGGSDRLTVHRGMTGWGAATLTKDGVDYQCRVQEHSSNGHYEFYAYLDEQDANSAIYGILLEDNLFRYRNDDEVGFFVNYSFITDEFYDYYILFDGYGMGGYMVPANDGTGRYFTYMLEYERNDSNTKFVEYLIYYYSPIDPENDYGYDYLIFSDDVPDGAGNEFDGSFVLLEYEGLIGYFYLVDNGEIDYYYALYLDGYGYAELLEYDIYSEQYVVVMVGVYIASENYYLYGDAEYIFLADGVDEQFHFIWNAVEYDSEIFGYYMERNEELYGTFTAEDGTDAELYLDGYAGAMYYSNDRDPGRYGSYTYSQGDENLIIKIAFADELGGTMTALLDLQNGTFKVAVGNFIIVDGVLTGYEGSDSVIVIPEGVVEIAAGVFSATNIDVNITSVTFPTTLRKIGDYAFSNGNVSGGSPLTTAIFLGSTPPELGQDVFRWIKGSNFKIIVPDDAAEAYRTAPTWTQATASQSDGYAKFVTTRYEIANKPLFEVVDGVLLSYNNKDENPHDVHIVIPENVTEIAYGVFAGLTYITSVDLSNVKIIGANAFYGCAGLAEVVFSSDTVSIGSRAFYECKLITSVNLGNVETIGDEAFSRCFGLGEVTIGAKIKSIGSQAFYMCSLEANANETEIIPHDLIVTIQATDAPDMGRNVFEGSQPRVYVPSYEVGVSYATDNSTWRSYLKHLRVKSSEQASTWYSIENLGQILELGDNVVFDSGSMIGLYKWQGNTLLITWFDYDGTSNTLGIGEARGMRSGNQISGIKIDESTTSYVFVAEGEQRTYRKSPSETLEITFGSTEAKFNGVTVTLSIGYSSTKFDYEGYTYTVTLQKDLTFSYTTTKITVVTTYTAPDGSTLIVYDGNIVTANGRIKNVDGNGLERWTETQGWYLTKVDDNVYWFRIDYLSYKYYVVVTLNPSDLTFTYTSSLGASIVTYTGEGGHRAIVTKDTSGNVTSIHILFKTASDTLEAVTTFKKISDDVYQITVDETVTEYDDEGNATVRDSEFNGTYTLTLNSNGTFTLEKLS